MRKLIIITVVSIVFAAGCFLVISQTGKSKETDIYKELDQVIKIKELRQAIISFNKELDEQYRASPKINKNVILIEFFKNRGKHVVIMWGNEYYVSGNIDGYFTIGNKLVTLKNKDQEVWDRCIDSDEVREGSPANFPDETSEYSRRRWDIFDYKC